MRTPVHMVCPQVRHLDAKNHRHLLQSAVCITPALRPLDKHIERHRTAFNRRPEQVRPSLAASAFRHDHGSKVRLQSMYVEGCRRRVMLCRCICWLG